MTPNGIDTSIEKIIEAIATSTVAGYRSTMVEATVCWLRKELPRSPAAGRSYRCALAQHLSDRIAGHHVDQPENKAHNDPHNGQHQQQTPQDEREHLSSIA